MNSYQEFDSPERAQYAGEAVKTLADLVLSTGKYFYLINKCRVKYF
jgi:hypothetical protein